MTTQTLWQPQPFYFTAPARSARRPFLEALERIEYGRLTLVTPEGNQLEFRGHEPGPTAYLRLYDWQVLDDLATRGDVGFAENYIDRRWETLDLPGLLTFSLMNAQTLESFFYGRPWYALWLRLRHLLQRNSLQGSRRNIMAHYDVGNDFYALWLDKSMTYSGALFEGDANRTLEEAQAAKYRRILNKIGARPGDHILDIGCGWGGFVEAAARQGIRVTAVTISEKQAAYARQRMRNAGLDNLVSIQLKDYREVEGTFDHVVSIGMFEHVGEHYWPTYFNTIKKRLKRGGKALIQCITLNDNMYDKLHKHNGFIEQYVFPGGALASKSLFEKTAAKANLDCRETFAFGQDYARTLRHWLERFEAKKDIIKALDGGYDDAFLRMWRFYLSVCIASFTTGRTDVIQAELVHA